MNLLKCLPVFSHSSESSDNTKVDQVNSQGHIRDCNQHYCLNNGLRTNTWEREKIIFDNDYSQLATQLKEYLITNRPNQDYDPEIVPMNAGPHSTAKVTIGIEFRLLELDDFDTNQETLSIIYTTKLYWYDPKLVWHRPNYDHYRMFYY